jgi:hypothetical protein
MAEGVYEIDRVLKRTALLYSAYTAVSLSVMSIAVSYRPWPVPLKLGLVLSLGLLSSGTCTWTHIAFTYTKQDVIYLKVGLDPEYAEIRRQVKRAK